MEFFMDTKNNKPQKRSAAAPVIAASYIGPALMPNRHALWEENELPLNVDTLVNEVMGQPMRRAGRFIKMVACGGLTCLQGVTLDFLKGKKTGIFLASGLGNVDEILPFITEVFKHGGGFPSPNQFANSVSNAAAFVLAKICDVTGTVLTISQEELSFEAALWLAQNYLEDGDIDLALVGGCDIFTPTVDEYRERLNLCLSRYRPLPMGEGSSWLLLGRDDERCVGEIFVVDFADGEAGPDALSATARAVFERHVRPGTDVKRIFLPGFRINTDELDFWRRHGWMIDDYLPCCGVHSTAAAFGIARVLRETPGAFFMHRNAQASGRQAVVFGATKKR
jgi:hypothetical protein